MASYSILSREDCGGAGRFNAGMCSTLPAGASANLLANLGF